MIHRFFLPLLGAAALLAPWVPGPARAAALHLRYEAFWGGLHAADFTLSLDDGGIADGAPFRTDFTLRTRGLVDWIIALRVAAHSQGALVPKAGLRPARYDVAYANRRRDRALHVAFDPDGGPAQATVTRDRKVDDPEPDNTETYGGTDALDADLRRGVIDPLTALVEAIRRARRDGAAMGDFTLAVYDGRRRFDVKGRYMERSDRDILGTRHRVDRIRLTSVPLAGFRRIHKVLWNDSTYDLYLSTDGRALPLQIDAVGPGPMINLVAECPTACALPED
ncbi:MAG: DUF3108 domain-containing protein [Rhodobacterales bacterium]|nr:DUF3108 domain-containing protein [Rhodobacterales bacterium]